LLYQLMEQKLRVKDLVNQMHSSLNIFIHFSIYMRNNVNFITG